MFLRKILQQVNHLLFLRPIIQNRFYLQESLASWRRLVKPTHKADPAGKPLRNVADLCHGLLGGISSLHFQIQFVHGAAIEGEAITLITTTAKPTAFAARPPNRDAHVAGGGVAAAAVLLATASIVEGGTGAAPLTFSDHEETANETPCKLPVWPPHQDHTYCHEKFFHVLQISLF